MIHPTPRWRYKYRDSFSKRGEGVVLLPDRVVGPWFCLDRATGQQLWQSRFWRPNTIEGVAQGVIVASEFRMDSPVTMVAGVYAISLESGRLLWVSHCNGWWGRFVRLLDYIPEFANEFRDAPLKVRPKVLITKQSRILDLRTGSLLGWLEPAALQALAAEAGVYNKEWPWGGDRGINCGSRGTIRAESRKGVFFLEDRQGSVSWVLDLAQEDPSIDPLPVRMLFLDPYLYVTLHGPIQRPLPSSWFQSALWAAEPSLIPIPEPDRAMLWVLDTRTGKIVQRVPLGEAKYGRFLVEAADSADLLISHRHPKSYDFIIECFARQ